MTSMGKTNIDKLMELKQLYEQGILTKEEMEVEKQKILGTASVTPEPKTSQTIEQQPPTEVEESADDSLDEPDIPFFEKYKGFVLGGIAIVLIVAGIAFAPKIISHTNSVPETDNPIAISDTPLILKGKIDEKIGFTMSLRCKGNEVEGTEHYDSQKSDANVLIKGTIENGRLILREYDNGVESGKFDGSVDDVSYIGTFTNSKGKNMSFTAKVLSEADIAKEEEAIKKVSEKGTLLANVDGKIYYLAKAKSDKMYDAEGENCGKLYIYNISDGKTTYENIHIPSGEPYTIDNYKYRDHKITFVLYDAGRNGFGVGNYCTEVSQYNIKTGRWKDIAEGCAKAEFIDNNRKIKITTAEITNYDEAAAAYEYKYDYSDTIIDL